MKLALIEKNLTEITAVNLAGIKPLVEKTVQLGDGHDYIDKSLRIDLDLAAERELADANGLAGAYLVICRGDDLFTSGLVLVTPLALEVQDDVGGGRVRVTAVSAIERDGLNDVHVKVIGAGMNRFISGETDLRGVYIADDVSGYPTAIARDADGHFAFYRSEQVRLAMLAETKLTPPPAPAQQVPQRGKVNYRSHLQTEQRDVQLHNEAQLQQMFQQQRKGVRVQEAE